MAQLRRDEGVPNIVLIGLPNLASLQKTAAKLAANNIPHYNWIEPDAPASGFNAIATAPLDEDQRKILRNYRVYNTGIAQLVERRGSNPGEAGSRPAPRANGAGAEASARV